jgi:uncharacterized membrane protein YedE/YeeE
MSVFKDAYKSVFLEQWPYWVGGIGLAVIALLLWISGQPWGVIGGYRNWGDWFFYGVGLYDTAPVSVLLDTKALMATGLVIGAFAAALVSGQFGLRMPPWWEIGKGLTGGAFMGFGAYLTGGCNIGAFYSSIAALSLTGVLMMVGLLLGAFLGLKYLAWEMESVPVEVLSKGIQLKPSGISFQKLYPYLGWLVIIAAFFIPFIYSRFYYTRIGMVLMLGVLSGIVMHRSRFCFAAAFRDPFMTGEGGKVRALFLSLFIYTLGVAILKWRGFVPENWYVFNTAGWGALIGGVIFGLGMILAGGCGSGTLFRVGEGQLKLAAALVSMSLVNSFSKHYLNFTLGKKIFLPRVFGSWTLALLFIFGITSLWCILATWNEDKERFVLF